MFFFLSGIFLKGWASDDTANIPVQVNGDQVQYFDAEKKMVGQGNVVVTYKDIKMTCKKVTAFVDSKEATAEGDVVVTRGEEILKGQKVIYNFQTESGTIIDGVAHSDVWYGGGKELKKTGQKEIDIKDGYITTCDLEKPHYSIRSKSAKIYMGKRVVAKNVTFNVGGVPVLFLPVYSQPIGEKMSKINVVPGSDKKWGAYVLTSYRYNLSDDMKGNLHLDYRQKKGLGEGVDYNLSTKDFGKGNARIYYISETDKDKDKNIDRWRAQYRHKWDIRPDTGIVLDYNRSKDRDFIKDYFYREEFEKDPQPKSYMSVNHVEQNYTVLFMAQKRVNKFLTDVEQLPEADLNIKNQRVMDGLPFFYKADFDTVNLNRRVADSNQDNSVIRSDTDNRLSAPFRLADFISVDPYAGTRQTFYTRQAQTDRQRVRGAFYTGLDLSTNFYRIYNARPNAWNLDVDGLRHIFTPGVSYYYVHKPTVQKEKFFEFDDVDTLDKKHGIGFSIENKLQTKREEKGEKNTAELARWVLGSDYLFDSSDIKKRLADISSDLELSPYRWLFFKQDALFDPADRELKSLYTDLAAVDPKEKWRWDVGHIYEQGEASQVTTQLEARITPQWKFRVFEMYEFKESKFKEQEYSITKDLHCWETEFTYSVRDGNTFWIIFRLKAFPEMPLRLHTTYYNPRAGLNHE